MKRLTWKYILPFIHPDLRDEQNYLSLVARYIGRAKQVYTGRNRITFDMGRYVVKLPSNFDGFTDNDWEGSVSNGPEQLARPTEFIQYARTRLAVVGEIPICLMDRVDTNVRRKKYAGRVLPDWVNSVDCQQVGYTRRGRLVAYDWGPR